MFVTLLWYGILTYVVLVFLLVILEIRIGGPSIRSILMNGRRGHVALYASVFVFCVGVFLTSEAIYSRPLALLGAIFAVWKAPLAFAAKWKEKGEKRPSDYVSSGEANHPLR